MSSITTTTVSLLTDWLPLITSIFRQAFDVFRPGQESLLTDVLVAVTTATASVGHHGV